MSKRVSKAINTGMLLIVVAALAMGGLALAQTADDDAGDPPPPNAAYEHILDLLAPLVEDGTITDAQAAAVAERLADAATDRRIDGPRADLLGALAELLGMTPAEIAAQVRSGASVAALAEAAGVPLSDVVARVLAPMIERLRAAVAAGELTEEEAARRIERATERVTDHLASDTPLIDRRIRRLEERREQLQRRRAQQEAILDVLEVSPEELREAADAGDSLADVADARGVDTDEVVDALVGPVAERLEQAVAEGDITEEEAARRLARATERATDSVERPIREHRLRRPPKRDRPNRDRRDGAPGHRDG